MMTPRKAQCDQPPERRTEYAGHAMGLFVALSFGSSYPLAKPIVTSVDPLTFACARYLLAGLVILGVRLAVRAPVAVERGDLARLAGLALLGFTTFQGVWAVALAMTTPAKGVVLLATAPIFGTVFGAIAGERLSPAGWAGVLAAFAGVFVLVNDSLTEFNLGGGSLLGDALFCGIAAVWAAYGALSRDVITRLGVWRVTGWCAMLGSLALVPLAAAGALAQDWSVVDGAMAAAFLHVSLVVGCVGIAAWNGGLLRLGLARIVVYLYLSPVAGVLLSGWLLDQWLSAVQLVGAAAVLAGVAMTQVLGQR